VLADGKSNKFWNIELKGSSYTIIFGKIGTAGQSQEKSFDSDEGAEKAFEKLVAEKLKDGYIDEGPGRDETDSGSERKLQAEGRLPRELELLLQKFSGVTLKEIREDEEAWASLEETVGEWDSDESLFDLAGDYEIDLENFQTNPVSGKGAVVTYRVTAGGGGAEDMEDWDEELLTLEFRLYLIDENEEEKEVNLDLGYWEVKELNAEEFLREGTTQFNWVDYETKVDYTFNLHRSA
jgi:predicted DNA-binding WGR domain protein